MKNQNNKANENKNKVNDCGGKCGKNSEKNCGGKAKQQGND